VYGFVRVRMYLRPYNKEEGRAKSTVVKVIIENFTIFSICQQTYIKKGSLAYFKFSNIFKEEKCFILVSTNFFISVK